MYWLLKLKPDADEAMQIAAYAHDIERAFARPPKGFYQDKELNDPIYLKKHQENGAKIITEFLEKQHYPEAKRVAEMVRLHEIGGTPEADLIKDADSISYFEVNAQKHIKKFGIPYGKQKVLGKYNFMFNRISSQKAKDLARPIYEKVLQDLEAEYEGNN